MGRVHVVAHTTVPAQRFIDALTDFSNRDSGLWGNSDVGYLKVHDSGPGWADVTEGSKAGGGIWQRYRYDWSAPGVVRLDVLDSNTFGRGSSWEYHVRPDHNGSVIDLTVHRVPNSRKGRLLDPVLNIVGKFIFGRDLRRTLRRLEDAPQHEGP